MKCDIILRKLLVQLFAVLSVTLCISCLNENKAKAIDCEEYFSFLEDHAQEVTNTSLKTSIDSLIYQYKNSETVKSVIEANWLDNNVVGVNFPNYSANTWMRVTFNFYNFEEGTKVYKDGNYAFYPPRSNTGDKNFYINYAANGNVNTYGYQNNNSYYTDLFSSNTKMTWVTDSYPVYTSSTSDTIATYYFSDILTRGPQFIPRNYVDIVFYEQTWWKLGYIDGQFEKSKCSFYFYDVTDPDNLYPPMIATLNNGLKLEDDGDLEIETRLIQSYHTYDIYFLYER